MKINQIASKPQLVKLILDDEFTVKKFGEPVEFWTWDRQPLDTFLKLVDAQSNLKISEVFNVVRELILDEDGKQIITGETTLPAQVLMQAIEKISKLLGN